MNNLCYLVNSKFSTISPVFDFQLSREDFLKSHKVLDTCRTCFEFTVVKFLWQCWWCIWPWLICDCGLPLDILVNRHNLLLARHAANEYRRWANNVIWFRSRLSHTPSDSVINNFRVTCYLQHSINYHKQQSESYNNKNPKKHKVLNCYFCSPTIMFYTINVGLALVQCICYQAVCYEQFVQDTVRPV